MPRRRRLTFWLRIPSEVSLFDCMPVNIQMKLWVLSWWIRPTRMKLPKWLAALPAESANEPESIKKTRKYFTTHLDPAQTPGKDGYFNGAKITLSLGAGGSVDVVSFNVPDPNAPGGSGAWNLGDTSIPTGGNSIVSFGPGGFEEEVEFEYILPGGGLSPLQNVFLSDDYGFITAGYGFQDREIDGVWQAVTAAPEASVTMMMALGAVAGLAGLRIRRRGAAAIS